MTTTYNPEQIEGKDKVRFSLGDTATPWLLVDEEIDAVLSASDGVVREATRRCCLALIGRLSRGGQSVSLGPFSVSRGELVAHYQALYRSLQDDMAVNTAISPYSGGQSSADRGDLTASDINSPVFSREDMPT